MIGIDLLATSVTEIVTESFVNLLIRIHHYQANHPLDSIIGIPWNKNIAVQLGEPVLTGSFGALETYNVYEQAFKNPTLHSYRCIL